MFCLGQRYCPRPGGGQYAFAGYAIAPRRGAIHSAATAMCSLRCAHTPTPHGYFAPRAQYAVPFGYARAHQIPLRWRSNDWPIISYFHLPESPINRRQRISKMPPIRRNWHSWARLLASQFASRKCHISSPPSIAMQRRLRDRYRTKLHHFHLLSKKISRKPVHSWQ